MKIALVCSHGGHLTEMQLLMDVFKQHEIVFVTYRNPQTEKLNYQYFLMENIGKSTWKMIKAFGQSFKFLIKYKPDLIVSTGAEIAIPFFVLSRFMMIKTIYIESWCRIKTKSGTGKLLYYLSNLFLVQWENLLKIYGKRARFEGAVI